MFHEKPFDFLALVLFTPELDLASGFLLPRGLLKRYSRGRQNRDGKVGLRVTSDLFSSPEATPLRLRASQPGSDGQVT
jgi:hypothetical protein